MLSFSNIEEIITPDGSVTAIRSNGAKLWGRYLYGYVSLGDSIAAGHTIDDDWEKNYGYSSQYGENNNSSTAIVPNSYNNLIVNELKNKYGERRLLAKSFAHSGDTVADLMEKLSHPNIINAIKQANVVTVCIGANDVLQPAMMHFNEYINGDISKLNATVLGNIERLNNDNELNSYMALLRKLNSINPDAKYVFTTIYNPYKYLYLEKSTAENDYTDGFLGPLMSVVPNVGTWATNVIRGAFINAPAVENLFNKTNELSVWAERYVNMLNDVIKSKITAFNKPNFLIADTKAFFDTVPDRVIEADKHYNNLVNVELTRNYTVAELDWGRFWKNTDWGEALGNINSIATETINSIIEHVIIPDVDPHPEWYGHYFIKRAIKDALGEDIIERRNVEFNANGANGAVEPIAVPVIDDYMSYVIIPNNSFVYPTDGYIFDGWNTSADGNGVDYQSGDVVAVNGDITFYAKWTNMCKVTVRHTYDVIDLYNGSKETGPKEKLQFWIDGQQIFDYNNFADGTREYYLPYGSQVGVVVQVEDGDARSYIELNGVKVAGNSNDSRYTFDVKSNMDINYEWNWWINGLTFQSYWNCYVETY